ncbi:MAG: hypothetical protein KDE14_07810 [Rhodobacteraceae bacterium]|nr:hypothetical protein [Paracoccaceae bacterium]
MPAPQRPINRRLMLFGAGGIAAIAAATAWYLTHWSDAEIEQVRNLQSAIFDVQMAIDYVNRRGGALDPEQTREVLAYYQHAQARAADISDEVLARVHTDLPRVWPEIFRRSTELYVGALENSNRDRARDAALLQDNWIRWYNLNKRKMSIPRAATSGAKPAVAISTSVAPRKDKSE